MPECKNDKDPCDILPVAGEAWSVCLPFGGRIWADGSGVHANGGIAPPDGVYGKVVIADGCIVGVEPADIPIYNGSPCAPQPCGCEDNADLGGGFTPGNTIITCEIEAGANVTVTGNGTEISPYVISADSGIFLRSDNSAIAVSGSGTRQNPYVLKHKAGLSTTVGGLTFDAFGHLTSVNQSSTSSKGITGIVPGAGVQVETDNATGIATIGLAPQPSDVPGDYQLGGFDLTLDATGRVFAINQQITIQDAPVTVPCGTTNLQINQYGSIMGITDTLNLGAAYLLRWPDAGTGPRVAQFTTRCNSALAGVLYTDMTTFTGIAVSIDGSACEKINKLFWGNGVYLLGNHSISITGVTGQLAVMLHSVTMSG